MEIEKPGYYDKFRCIGGKCQDTCCAGWEVDVDEESFYYYQTVPGEFGERLRKNLREEGSEKYFPLTEEKRCPFLNRQNLCDIYTALGEEALCQVCTEYPRYFMEAGPYQQMDMSLSCMELGRIFFCEEDKIRYIREQDAYEGNAITPEEEQELVGILALRNQCIQWMQDMELAETEGESLHFPKHFRELIRLVLSQLGSEKTAEEFFAEALSDLPERFSALEVLDRRWTDFCTRFFAFSEEASAETMGKFYRNFRQAFSGAYDDAFRKLTIYFLFRYMIDSFYEDSVEDILRLLVRSIQTIEIMAAERFLQQGSFTMTDMIDVAHLYSKEVEHAEENLLLMKQEGMGGME